MLTDIGRRDQNFSQRYGVIRQEVDLKKVVGVRIGVDDTSNVNYKANSLSWMIRISSRKYSNYKPALQYNLDLLTLSIDVDGEQQTTYKQVRLFQQRKLPDD